MAFDAGEDEFAGVLSGARPVGWIGVVLGHIDILPHISRYLEPRHIVLLSGTNRAVASCIEQNRSVWLSALYAIQILEAMAANTYDFEKMEVRELRDAACAPYRLTASLRGKGSGSTSTRTRVFDLKTRRGPPPQYSMYLVPGGRWLVHCDQGTSKPGDGPRIGCSDLRVIRNEGFQPSISLDLLFIADSWPTLHMLQSDPDNRGFIVVVSYLLDFPKRCVEVIRGQWSAEPKQDELPTLSREGFITLDLEGHVPSITLECEHVCIPLSELVVVWNWKRQTWVAISFPLQLRGAWILDNFLYTIEERRNALSVFRLPRLESVSNPPYLHAPEQIRSLVWREGPRLQCEVAMLGNFHPQYIRASKLFAIIYWGSGGTSSGVHVLDLQQPATPSILNTWEQGLTESSFGVHSAALQTVDVRGISVRCGRRFLARLASSSNAKSSSNLEFRIRAFFSDQERPRLVAFPVDMPDTWEEAEIYDTCTILGRVLLRQYDSTSDSEHDDDYRYPELAVLDFIYPGGPLSV